MYMDDDYSSISDLLKPVELTGKVGDLVVFDTINIKSNNLSQHIRARAVIYGYIKDINDTHYIIFNKDSNIEYFICKKHGSYHLFYQDQYESFIEQIIYAYSQSDTVDLEIKPIF